MGVLLYVMIEEGWGKITCEAYLYSYIVFAETASMSSPWISAPFVFVIWLRILGLGLSRHVGKVLAIHPAIVPISSFTNQMINHLFSDARSLYIPHLVKLRIDFLDPYPHYKPSWPRKVAIR